MPILESLKTSGEIVGAFTAAAITIWNAVGKQWWRKYKTRKRAENDHIISELKSIKSKLFPNGGTSIDDKLELSLKDNLEIKKFLEDLSAGQRNTWEIMDIAIWKSDKDGRTIYVNKPYMELTGCQYHDALGMSWTRCVADFDRQRIRNAWLEAVRDVADFDECYFIELNDGSFQKVNALAIHNREKQDGALRNSTGRLIKIGDPIRNRADAMQRN